MSCAFVVAEDRWDDDYTTRSISSFKSLEDVSAVTYPASQSTSIALAGSRRRP
jgi:phage head maturation protease